MVINISRAQLCRINHQATRQSNAQLVKKLAKRRSQLQTKIDRFLENTPHNLASILSADHHIMYGQLHPHPDGDFPDEDEEEEEEQHKSYDEDDDDDDDDDDSKEEEEDIHGEDGEEGEFKPNQHNKPTNASGAPEHTMLPLPSALGLHKHHDPIIAALTQEELLIRQSQASEALQQLRLSLGMKSAIFRSMASSAKSQKTKTRAWRAVHTTTAAVKMHAKSYCLARHALVQLNVDQSILTRFPPLEKSDLTVSRDVLEESRVGQRSEHVSWIWRQDIGKDQHENEWMYESE
jgi:hypothetical protein